MRERDSVACSGTSRASALSRRAGGFSSMVKRTTVERSAMKAPETDGPVLIPPELKWLKWLVIALAGVMIAGFLVLIAAIVIRLDAAPALPLPESIALPQGAEAMAFTQGRDWIAVVTTDDRVLIYGRDGDLRQSMGINRAE